MTSLSEAVNPPAPSAPGRKRRAGCIIAVVLWFLLLLTPCLCFYFAVQQEVNFALSDAPGHAVRIWLVMEPRSRGLGSSVGTVVAQTDTDVCVQTETSYLLWTGTPENTTYCECSARAAPSEPWIYQGSTAGACAAAP